MLTGKTVSLGGTSPTIVASNTATATTINSNFVDASANSILNVVLTAASTNSVTLNLGGVLSGSGTINQYSGIMMLGGANTFSGTYYVSGSGGLSHAILKPLNLGAISSAANIVLYNASSGTGAISGQGTTLDLTALGYATFCVPVSCITDTASANWRTEILTNSTAGNIGRSPAQ